MDSKNSSLKSTVLFGAAFASLGAFNYGYNSAVLNIPGAFVKHCTGVSDGVVTYYPNTSLPQCLPMSDWVW